MEFTTEFTQDRAFKKETFYMPFGKYKGATIAEVYEEDPKYFEWLEENMDGRS